MRWSDRIAKLVGEHDYMGACPDIVEGYDARDSQCKACQVLDAIGVVVEDVMDGTKSYEEIAEAMRVLDSWE